jgi:hypothetical protein
MSEAKPFTRIVTDAAGGSAFEDGQIPLETQLVAEDAPPVLVGSVPATAAAVYVRGMSDSGPHPIFHPAPRKQWVVVLTGAIEVEVTDGPRRTFGPGDLIHAEDTDSTSPRGPGTGRSKHFSCPAKRRHQPGRDGDASYSPLPEAASVAAGQLTTLTGSSPASPASASQHDAEL